jgi:hypothetical protein
MTRSYDQLADSDEKRRKLESRLYDLLHVILNQMPEPIHRAAYAFYRLEARETVWEWHRKLGEVIIENAVPIRNERQAAIARWTNERRGGLSDPTVRVWRNVRPVVCWGGLSADGHGRRRRIMDISLQIAPDPRAED